MRARILSGKVQRDDLDHGTQLFESLFRGDVDEAVAKAIAAHKERWPTFNDGRFAVWLHSHSGLAMRYRVLWLGVAWANRRRKQQDAQAFYAAKEDKS
jgi:hypothetical protein